MPHKTKKEDIIRQICSHPDFYVGVTVTFEGIFRGWSIGRYDFPVGAENHSPKTRSDWLIVTGPDCAYVTGGAPPHVSAGHKEDIGCRIEITATVALSDDGGIYFEFVRGRQLAPKIAKAAA